MKKKLHLVWLACAVTACTSTPRIAYYTLAMDPSGAAHPSVNLVVERVRTSEALNRSQVMIQTSPTEIEYYATAQWAGTLADLIGQKLAVEFGPAVEGRRTIRLTVMVLSCEQVDIAGGAEARMKLAVTMRDSSDTSPRQPLLEKTYETSRPAAQPSAGAVVEALSICAELLAREIAADASAV